MYLPRHFTGTDTQQALAFIRTYSFGTLVTCAGSRPEANHIPFVAEMTGDRLVLSSHLAKANPQSDGLDGRDLLAIFTEPHAYISPSHYEKEQNVPTWNYIAVHVYGKARVIDNELHKSRLLEKMILTYEMAYMEQWSGLPDEYKYRMMKGIVAFEMEVFEVQAKYKLSQNRTEEERERIIRAFRDGEPNEQQLAAYMSDRADDN